MGTLGAHPCHVATSPWQHCRALPGASASSLWWLACYRPPLVTPSLGKGTTIRSVGKKNKTKQQYARDASTV